MKNRPLFRSTLLRAVLASLIWLVPFSARAFNWKNDLAIIPKDMYEEHFKTGEFEWSTLVEFALHIIQLLIGAAGIFAVIFLMIGGFQIVLGSTMDDQDSGKTTIKNTLVGFVVILLAWTLVDMTIAFLTSAS